MNTLEKPRTNVDLMYEYAKILQSQGRILPPNKVISDDLRDLLGVQLKASQIGTALERVRRSRIKVTPEVLKFDGTNNRKNRAIMHGKGDIWPSVEPYVNLQMSPREIHWAILLHDERDVPVRSIYNALFHRRTRNDLQPSTILEKDSFRRTVNYATEQQLQARVRVWLVLKDFVFNDLGAKHVPFRRYDWLDMIDLSHRGSLDSAQDVAIDQETVISYVASLERLIEPRQQLIQAVGRVGRSLLRRFAIGLEEAIAFKEAEKRTELWNYVNSNFVNAEKGSKKRKVTKPTEKIIRRIDSLPLSLEQKVRLFKCVYWEEETPKKYGKFFGVPDGKVWQNVRDLIDGDMDDLHAMYDLNLLAE